ncbi:MAG: hypothetical protein JXQ73_04310 [Phycisphaerae bacterium]|nr:hypothetical protein [Phycisphaerae bacterium]
MSIALNVFVPGTGLVLARRERWGTSLAFVFAVFGQVVLFGGWITPSSIPRSMTLVAAVGAVATWLVAQGLLLSRLSVLRGPAFPSDKATLLQLGREALEDGIYVNARLAIESALALDDEDVVANVLWARLMTLMGRFSEARRAWRRVQQLDPGGDYRREAVAALRQLPSER